MSLRSTFRPADSFERNLYRGSFDSAVDAVITAAKEEPGGYACFCNVHLWTVGRRSPQARRALDNARLVFADGRPIAWLYGSGKEAECTRIAGPDLMWRVLDKGREQAVSHFFYGATPGVLAALIERVRRDLPGVRVAGAISPPFGDVTRKTQRSLVDQMVAADAHIIWCALGAPRQEEWMYRHAEALKPTLVLGVGAAFNFLAGAKHRAPTSVQRLGFEWLHRLVSEPRRLAPRYFRTNTQFLCDLAGEALKTVGGSAPNVGIRRLR